MKTAMQELFDEMTSVNWHLYSYEDKIKIINIHLEKEKEQIKKAFSDGQETPLNHPALPHYSNDEYYNDNFNLKN